MLSGIIALPALVAVAFQGPISQQELNRVSTTCFDPGSNFTAQEQLKACNELLEMRDLFTDAHLDDVYTARGDAYEQMGEYEHAIDDFTEALNQRPDYAEVYVNRGNDFGEIGERQKALDDYNHAIRLKPEYAPAYVSRGVALASDVKFAEQAIGDYTTAIRLKPSYAEAYYDRGIEFLAIGSARQAILDFSEAIRLRPEIAESYRNRGLAYKKMGDDAAAMADSLTATRLKPSTMTGPSIFGRPLP